MRELQPQCLIYGRVGSYGRDLLGDYQNMNDNGTGFRPGRLRFMGPPSPGGCKNIRKTAGKLRHRCAKNLIAERKSATPSRKPNQPDFAAQKSYLFWRRLHAKLLKTRDTWPILVKRT